MIDLIPYALMFLAGFATSQAIIAYLRHRRFKAFVRFMDEIIERAKGRQVND